MNILITGASRGIGNAVTEKFLIEGFFVWGLSRSDVYTPFDHPAIAKIRCDVDRVYTATLPKEIDVLVNCAGYGLLGSFEDTSWADATWNLSTNLWGTMRVTKYALPMLRNSSRGMVFNVSSTSGINGYPFEPVYCAAKFGVEGFSEALYHELKPLGIQVKLIEPGPVATTFSDHMVFTRVSKDYQEAYDRAQEDFYELEEKGYTQSPNEIADLVWEIYQAADPETFRFPTGKFAMEVAEKRFRKVGPCEFR